MLKHLTLKDFVIVSQLELTFHAGFSVLTGETGAGKSILIDALQLVLGARAESHWVREGAARAEVTAEFDPPPSWPPGWTRPASPPRTPCCCAASSTARARAAASSTAAPPPPPSCARWPTTWWTSTASTPGRA
jgi:DNA repair protein RecN (Recombination protein N)